MINEICKYTDIRMGKCVETFKNHIRKIRTGRVSPSLLDDLQIEYYGLSTSLHCLAHIYAEDSRTLSITVFDHAVVPAVEKAIITSDLGLNPSSSGTKIHVPFPPLSEERRRNMIKVVRSEAEKGRISVRNIRRDANDKIKKFLKDKTINDDEEHHLQQEIQKSTDTWIKILDSTLEKKELELMET